MSKMAFEMTEGKRACYLLHYFSAPKMAEMVKKVEHYKKGVFKTDSKSPN